MARKSYNMDFPRDGDCVGSLFRCSGWDLRDGVDIGVALDGLPVASLCRSYREDLRTAFPDHVKAVISGFLGDIVVCDVSEGPVTLELVERADGQWAPYHSVKIRFRPSSDVGDTRVRDYDLNDILAWPGEKEKIGVDYVLHSGRGKRVSRGSVETYAVQGVKHFHPLGDLPLMRLSEKGSTHPYGGRSVDVIRDAKGLVLDLGAGIQDLSSIAPNMVLVDAVHFKNLDVVNTCSLLPFQDECFDAVVSQAVFEHLADPFLMAREVHRVLQPGGIFYLTTAFMQPMHGDPSHYFNMTTHGLRRVLEDFVIEDIGIEPFQYPSYGIEMAIEAVLPFLKGGVEGMFQDALKIVKSKRLEIDEGLGPMGREILAAGVFAVARKRGSR